MGERECAPCEDIVNWVTSDDPTYGGDSSLFPRSEPNYLRQSRELQPAETNYSVCAANASARVTHPIR